MIIENTKATPMFGQPRFVARLVPCLLTAILVVAIGPGCNSGRFPIQGEVTFDGQPVETGTIAFEPADGQGPTTGGQIKNGKYALMGNAAPLPGKKKVRISAVHKTGRRIPAGPPAAQNEMIEEIIRYIPAIYNSRSTLFCDVSADRPPQINFDLKSQKN